MGLNGEKNNRKIIFLGKKYFIIDIKNTEKWSWQRLKKTFQLQLVVLLELLHLSVLFHSDIPYFPDPWLKLSRFKRLNTITVISNRP